MRKTQLHSVRLPLLSFLLVVVVAGACALNASPGGSGQSPPGDEPVGVVDNGEIVIPESVNWEQVEKLIGEQKVKAALELVEVILADASENNLSDEWTRALIEQAKLRMALHGYETAVRQLRQADWPDDSFSRAVLNLMYAHSLATYTRSYSWEIRQRERVETSEEIDLKAWTMDQIVAEAHSAYTEIWSERDEWGSESLGAFSRYVNQNNYPARIRGTLRDAVTYMWIELLVDTSLWTPRQTGEVYRLDADALIAGDARQSRKLALDAADVHPLLKIGALLDDLESWHTKADRDEAALEARLERVRRLMVALDNSDDKLSLRRDLAKRLERFDRRLAWWAMGQGQLADLLRAESAPDALVRARAAAQLGLDRHPESLGGQKCRHIVATIEAPSYSIQSMYADGIAHRSIQITHRNLSELHFRAWRVDLRELIDDAEDYNLLPAYREIPQIMSSR
ncbi:MAG: hypothetical protein GY906_03110, partial [bacterium]|nr:hypothetical protein [bacterium]